MAVAQVKVKSAAASKINWTAGVAIAGTLLTMFGFDLPVEQQATIVAAINIVAGLSTWLFRTFFNKSVTGA